MLDNGTIAIGAGDSLRVTGTVDPASSGLFSLAGGSVLEFLTDTGAGSRISFLASARLLVDAAAQFGSHVGTTAYRAVLQTWRPAARST